MKIPVCRVSGANNRDHLRCPNCHGARLRKHGFYVRKGFHAPNCATALAVKVQRYLCHNPHCRRSTFSVLPHGVVRYCRFYWQYLLALNRALSEGATVYRLARHVWHVARGVIMRAAALLKNLEHWATELHRELTDGATAGGLEGMVECVSDAIGRFEFAQRWYRHRYPRRFL